MKRVAVLGVLFFALAAIGYVAYARLLRQRALPDGLIQANGRIEGDHIAVSSKFAGRIAELTAYEGDEVEAGQIVTRLDDAQVRAKFEQTREHVAVCEARIKAASARIEAALAKVQAAQTSLTVLRKQVPLRIAASEADLAHARAAAASADSSEGKARQDVQRNRQLAANNAVSQDELEDAELILTIARNALTTADAAVTRAEKTLAEAKLGTERIKVQEDELLALQADVTEARASRDECIAARNEAQAAMSEAQSVIDDFTILSPSDGVITTRMADVGEFVSPGAPLFDVVDLDRLYLKVYVAEVDIGKVRLGLPAKIHTDAFPNRPFDAMVRYISSRAEFTPREVQTPDERVKLVYAVRLYLNENPDQCLTPGLPADAVIRWKEEAKWAKPIW